ncbi:helix-turn-helix transcriptional regulator [Limosilactobacillus avium]|uniref:helix-turn-helix transcriptional regulator n=1 Tax=Limosilactobacillus avium TaxID=2991831 RepID=UPI0024B953AD|nr:helix-turn-helix domain-containing protein [Limosilactobacillus avium]
MLHRENKIRQYHTSLAADLIKEVMDHYDITQDDLASRIGVSQEYISDILNRRCFLDELLVLRIEKVMGISGKLLLSLDLNYRLRVAKQKSETNNKVSTP